MKSIKVLTAIFGIATSLNTGLAFAQKKDVHNLEPKNGGIVVENNHMEYELVLKPEATELYVTDHGKAIDLSKANAKVTVLDGGQKIEKTLKGQGQVLKGEGVSLKGSAYTAVVTVEFESKKKATVRFARK